MVKVVNKEARGQIPPPAAALGWREGLLCTHSARHGQYAPSRILREGDVTS